LDTPAVWLPITQQPDIVNGSRLLTDFSADDNSVRMWGRLKPDLTPKVAEEELRSLAAELRKRHPNDIWEKESLPSEPGGYAKSLIVGTRRGTGAEDRNELFPISALIGALCLLILAVACANLGSLLLARGVAREREIAIRVAVGAGGGLPRLAEPDGMDRNSGVAQSRAGLEDHGLRRGCRIRFRDSIRADSGFTGCPTAPSHQCHTAVPGRLPGRGKLHTLDCRGTPGPSARSCHVHTPGLSISTSHFH
jgi:hypothetical protein